MNNSKVFLFLSALIFLGSFIVAFVPGLRQSIYEARHSMPRKIVSTVNGNVIPKEGATKIIKFKTPNGLRLEFLGAQTKGSRQLISAIDFNGHTNAFFDLNGFATDLALVDLDHDGVNEVVAPSLDPSLLPRLNALRFDPITRSFIPMSDLPSETSSN